MQLSSTPGALQLECHLHKAYLDSVASLSPQVGFFLYVTPRTILPECSPRWPRNNLVTFWLNFVRCSNMHSNDLILATRVEAASPFGRCLFDYFPLLLCTLSRFAINCNARCWSHLELRPYTHVTRWRLPCRFALQVHLYCASYMYRLLQF